MAILRTIQKAQRIPSEPILLLRTGDQYWWEKRGVFNPGVAEYNGKIVLMYRAYDEFRISRLGLAISKDGITFQQFEKPAIDTKPEDPDERLGIEDPRITCIDGTYYIVHTSASYHRVGEPSDVSGVMDYIPWKVRIGMHSTKDFQHFIHRGVILPNTPAKNACLLPERINDQFAMYYRQRKELKLIYTSDFKNWSEPVDVHWPVALEWQKSKFGVGAPPLVMKDGLLMVYHAVDDNHVYRLGLMMFDRNDPSQLLWYSNQILEPEQTWEKEGYIPNVVYTCGAIIRNNELWIYYGAADYVIGRAVLSLSAII